MTERELALKGALEVLRVLQRNLRMSGWEGATYHDATKDARLAWDIYDKCMSAITEEMRYLRAPQMHQAAALLQGR